MISLVFAATARGHDSTVMHVDAEARPGFVTLTFHLEQRDVLQAVLKSDDADRFRDEDEFQAAADTIASFMRRGARVTRGGKTIEPAPLSEWPPSRVTLTTKDPDGQLSATTIPFTIVFPIATRAALTQPAPDNASRDAHNHEDVEVAFSLFETTGLSATYSVSVWHPGMERSELVVLASRDTLLLPAIPPEAASSATSPSAAPTSRPDAGPPEWTRGPIGTFAYFVPIGFGHIIPEGLDHILFVLGLFLLSPRLRPLLAQVTAFTVDPLPEI